MRCHVGVPMRCATRRLLLCIAPILLAPMAWVIPAEAAQIYWTDIENDTIQCADLDGSNVRTLVSSTGAFDLAVDLAGGYVYFSDYLTNRMRRMDLDGSHLTDLFYAIDPFGIALDPVGGQLYWSNGENLGAHLDGSNEMTVV